ncbi:MAG: CotH kinase family protein, partial [Bacteroidetes bacterium]|nr:CotH kinase family protein [Bacteroidota bacterium]
DPRFTLFSFEKQYPDDDNLSSFVEFLEMLSKVSKDSTVKKEFETDYLDVPAYLTFHALMVITNNRDGLTNNFLLYRHKAHCPYEVITHDFDSAFDVDGDIELGGGNEIIRALLQIEEWRKQYYLTMKEIAEKYFTEDLLFPIIDTNTPKIVQTYNTASYFNENLYSYEVDALKHFITRRRADVISKCNAELER